jgi:predicted DNA-binding protein (UPF0251 family)
MPRRKRLRRIVAPPGFKGYRPYGHMRGRMDPIELLYEEYEAIKLADYDGLNHQEASVWMGISRPTFARIYEIARKKIARALVETREIRSASGNAWMDESWFLCEDCHSRFTIPSTVEKQYCPLCKSANIQSINTAV